MSYKVIVVPACDLMPVRSLKKAIDLAESGGLVIFEKMPGDVPGLHRLDERRAEIRGLAEGLEFTVVGEGLKECLTGKGRILVSGNIEQALEYAGIRGENINDHGLKFTRRILDDGKFYYLVNHNPYTVDESITINAKAENIMLMDPLDGHYGLAEMEKGDRQTHVRVQLQPGESVFLRTYDSPVDPDAGNWAYVEKTDDPLELAGPWKLEFVSGGPVLPGAVELETLQSWTALEDTNMLNFSGTAEYTLQFDQADISADEYILDLGMVCESAKVTLNGNDLGILWSIPYRLRVGDFLREGENILQVEVANLMANRIRYMDRSGISWRNFHEINFVNILYKPFDASGWDVMKSGLEGPFRIIPFSTNTGAQL